MVGAGRAVKKMWLGTKRGPEVPEGRGKKTPPSFFLTGLLLRRRGRQHLVAVALQLKGRAARHEAVRLGGGEGRGGQGGRGD